MERYQESLLKNDFKLIAVLLDTIIDELPKKKYEEASIYLNKIKTVLFASVNKIFEEKYQSQLDADNLLNFLNEKAGD